MPPMLAPLAQSESKKRFFERLHLNPDEPMHRKLYSMMKVRNVAVWIQARQSVDNTT
jgi:hypothetical protein